MKIYKTEREFEDELVAIIEKMNVRFGRGGAYFRRYLGDGLFEFYIIDGNPRTSHDTWLIDVKLIDDKIKFFDQKNLSMMCRESYAYQYETKADIFQEKVNWWVGGPKLRTIPSYEKGSPLNDTNIHT